MPPATSMTGITIRYKLETGTIFSAESTYTSDPGTPSPGTPPLGTLDPLADSEWDQHAIIELSTGFYTLQIWLDPATGPAVNAEWTQDNGATWHPTFAIGTDISGNPIFQLASVDGGQGHIVQYGESKTIRVRYYTDTGDGESSLISTGSITFVGPTAPGPVSEPGDIYTGTSDSSLSLSGISFASGQLVRPSTPGSSYLVNDNGDGTITVTGPSIPPLGTATVWARTDGPHYQLVATGQGGISATIPRGTSRFVYIHGRAEDGITSGRSLHIELP